MVFLGGGRFGCRHFNHLCNILFLTFLYSFTLCKNSPNGRKEAVGAFPSPVSVPSFRLLSATTVPDLASFRCPFPCSFRACQQPLRPFRNLFPFPFRRSQLYTIPRMCEGTEGNTRQIQDFQIRSMPSFRTSSGAWSYRCVVTGLLCRACFWVAACPSSFTRYVTVDRRSE